MSTKERIEAEPEYLDAEQLEQLYRVVRELSASKKAAASSRLMAKLKQVKIDGPEAFAANLDLYLNGGRRVLPKFANDAVKALKW